MKHLPNLLTLTNLFCGCIAIAYILHAQPFLSTAENGPYWQWTWVDGIQQAYLGSLFIFIAAVCDMLDGLAARSLQLFSTLGKDLDSLADLVSFGVAPSMILYKLLWEATMSEPNAFDASMLQLCPAFLIACFAALRLARFNTTETKKGFTGLPTPAVGLFIASFPLIEWYQKNMFSAYLSYTWVLYILIAVLCWLMVSRIHFFKITPAKWKMPYMWPQLTLVIVSLAAVPFIKIMAIPLVFVLYIVLSIIYKAPAEADAQTTA